MTFEEKIEQWKQLKQSKKAIEKRIKELRTDILTLPHPQLQQYGVTVQERNKTTFNEGNVWSLMHQKGIPEDMFTRAVIDEAKLEQLYYEGALTDDDLRYIRKPQYIYALIDSEVENVQEQTNDVR